MHKREVKIYKYTRRASDINTTLLLVLLTATTPTIRFADIENIRVNSYSYLSAAAGGGGGGLLLARVGCVLGRS